MTLVSIRNVYVNVNVYVKFDFTVKEFFTASTFIKVFSSSASHSFLKIIVKVSLLITIVLRSTMYLTHGRPWNKGEENSLNLKTAWIGPETPSHTFYAKFEENSTVIGFSLGGGSFKEAINGGHGQHRKRRENYFSTFIAFKIIIHGVKSKLSIIPIELIGCNIG